MGFMTTENLTEIAIEAENAFQAADTSAALENAKALFLGKTGRVTGLLKGLAALSLEEKKTQGAAIQALRERIETTLQARRRALQDAALAKELSAQALDVTLPGRGASVGSLHPVSLATERIENIFASIGFDVADGPEIETDWFNFTALNTPEHHPARSMHDTFYVESEANYLLRTHTSPIQIRYARERALAGAVDEIRVIAPGRTYRVDSDATHSPMFHQCEGLWLGSAVSFSDLKRVFTEFCRLFFESDDLKLRFRASYFPFTEPSAEIDIAFQSGKLAGRWLEVGGAGQVHPKVIANMNLDPEKMMGFAFGIGIDRFAMLRYGVDDLRAFFESDVRFLSLFSA